MHTMQHKVLNMKADVHNIYDETIKTSKKQLNKNNTRKSSTVKSCPSLGPKVLESVTYLALSKSWSLRTDPCR